MGLLLISTGLVSPGIVLSGRYRMKKPQKHILGAQGYYFLEGITQTQMAYAKKVGKQRKFL